MGGVWVWEGVSDVIKTRANSSCFNNSCSHFKLKSFYCDVTLNRHKLGTFNFVEGLLSKKKKLFSAQSV